MACPEIHNLLYNTKKKIYYYPLAGPKTRNSWLGFKFHLTVGGSRFYEKNSSNIEPQNIFLTFCLFVIFSVNIKRTILTLKFQHVTNFSYKMHGFIDQDILFSNPIISAVASANRNGCPMQRGLLATQSCAYVMPKEKCISEVTEASGQ